MAEFGDYPRRESRVYTIDVPAHTVPVQLHLSLPGSAPRDLVLIPEASAIQQYPEAFAAYSHSTTLESVFRYVGEGNGEIPLAPASSVPSSAPTRLRFALARWAPAGRGPLPNAIHCLLAVPYGTGEQPLHEIVAGPGQPAATEGAVQ